jgi:hypothetical protein
MASTVK